MQALHSGMRSRERAARACTSIAHLPSAPSTSYSLPTPAHSRKLARFTFSCWLAESATTYLPLAASTESRRAGLPLCSAAPCSPVTTPSCSRRRLVGVCSCTTSRTRQQVVARRAATTRPVARAARPCPAHCWSCSPVAGCGDAASARTHLGAGNTSGPTSVGPLQFGVATCGWTVTQRPPSGLALIVVVQP